MIVPPGAILCETFAKHLLEFHSKLVVNAVTQR